MSWSTKSLVPAVLLGTVMGWVIGGQCAQAAPAETAPDTLVSTLEAIEAAANAQDIDQVMSFYGDTFQGPDGFSRSQYQETLSQFWAQYNSLTYDVELLSWEVNGDTLSAETLTTVTGMQQVGERELTLTATVRSRQQYENGQVVAQEILAEESRLESGTMPPAVTVQLPTTVAPGQTFTFDAIVEEPLGDRLLLGRAFEEGVTPDDFLVPRPVDLEQLTAGGVFKIGTAPAQADQRWVSAVIIREDGIVVDTRRLSIGQ